MTVNMREAAEIVRRGDTAAVAGDEYGKYVSARGTLADFALSLLDETPLDEAWLLMQDQWEVTRDERDILVTIRHAPDRYTQLYRTPDGVWKLGTGSSRFMDFITLQDQPKTRGQISALVFALGQGGAE